MKKQKLLKNLPIQFLGESTGRGYERIRGKFNDIHPQKALPSIYKLNQDLPIDILPLQLYVPSNDDEEEVLKDAAKEEILLGIGDNKHLKTDEDVIDYFSPLEKLHNNKTNDKDTVPGDKGTKFVGSKLAGGYIDYLNLMIGMHKLKGHEIIDGEDIIVMNSFDGAEGFRSQKKVATVISFSSSLVTTRLINKQEVKAGSSFNILTWMQVLAKETFEVVNVSLKSDGYWNQRQSLVDGVAKLEGYPNSKVFIYDMHDGKMIYNMLQHSEWNRKHNPFILCKCNKDDGLEDNEHICDTWKNHTYEDAWNRSKRKWLESYVPPPPTPLPTATTTTSASASETTSKSKPNSRGNSKFKSKSKSKSKKSTKVS